MTDSDYNPAEDLAAAIELHRDTKYKGDEVTDALDLSLYDVAVWYRTAQDHKDDDEPAL